MVYELDDIMRNHRFTLPALAFAGVLLWGLIETIALWRARRSKPSPLSPYL
jgi:hypothetical protein